MKNLLCAPVVVANQVDAALNVMRLRIRTVRTSVTAVNQTVPSVCHGRVEAEPVDKYSCGLAGKLEEHDLGTFKGTVR